MAEPAPYTTRGVDTSAPRLNPNRNPDDFQVGLGDQVAAAWRTQWGPQLVNRMFESWMDPDPDFDPYDHMRGYERYAPDLMKAGSQQEIDAMKARIDRNIQDQQTIGANGLGWALAAEMLAGFGDPVNYIPIPIARGIGFAKGALRAGTANAALTAGSEAVRASVDPTMERDEAFMSIGASFLLGGAFGGVAGRMGRRGGASPSELRRTINQTLDDMDDLEGTDNWALKLTETGEGMEIRSVRETGDGSLARVADEVVPVRIKEVDGVNYFYEGRMPTAPGAPGTEFADGWITRWVRESEQKLDPEERTPIPRETLEKLGRPEMETQSIIEVREAKLKLDFEKGDTGDVEISNFKNAEEYVTYRTIEAIWRKLKPDLSPEEIQAKSLDEMKSSRESAFIGRAKAGTEWLLDKVNFSPVAKAARIFKDDNRLTSFALQVGGDYGWAIRANRLGYRTPPSLLVRSHKHFGRFLELRREIDDAFVEYANGGLTERSREFAGVNTTASVERVRRKFDKTKLQYTDFLEMVKRAVDNPTEDFTVNGFAVVPEARKAAKAVTRVLQQYHREARELDLFYTQRSVKMKLANKEAKLRKQEGKEVKFLWGEAGPSAWQFAINIGDKMYVGNDYEVLANQIMDELGPAVFDGIKREDYGFVRPGKAVPETISAAAIRYEGKVYTGKTHFDAMQAAMGVRPRRDADDLFDFDYDAIDDSDGFITSTGRYVDRAEAEQIATAADQFKSERQLPDYAAAEDINFSSAEPGSTKLNFRTFDEMRAERVESLTPKQRAVYDKINELTEEIRAERNMLEEMLEDSRANPQVFKGEPAADYFPRIYDVLAIAENQERFIRLATHYFGGDDAARVRAEEWTDALLKGREFDVGDEVLENTIQGFQSLRKRKVDWANGFKIEDPEFGEIRLDQFTENNVLSVMERYTRRMGIQIEAARMFGDPNLKEAIRDARMYALEKYGDPAKVDEYVNHVQNTFNIIAGTYRRTDPWSLSNRTARSLKDWTALATMGRVALTSLPEMFRPMMIAGIDGAFKSIIEDVMNDLPQLKHNKRWTRAMAGDATDLARDTFNPRFAEMQAAELGSSGGTWVERKLHDAVPIYYKLNGLTPMTMFLKDWTGIAAQHAIMKDVLEPDARSVKRLAALGIGERQAELLRQMPIETTKNGLILPVVQNWRGTMGRSAQRILLDATMAETRRAIVTPSVGDKSTLFYGLATRKGEYVTDNDWISVPFQFMSYGVAANNKVLGSMLQDRDRSMAGGIFAMMMAGLLSTYLKTPENAWNNKDYKERLIDAYEAAGLGGFILGDVNLMLERYSQHTLGLRPMMGTDPKFGKSGMDSAIDVAGPGPGIMFDLTRVFWDEDLSTTARAQVVRRAMIFNNYLFTAGLARGMATDVGEAFK